MRRVPADFMGTRDDTWFPIWLNFLLINDNYETRTRRSDDTVKETLSYVLGGLSDIGCNHEWDRKLIDDFCERITETKSQQKKIDLFSQEST